MPPTSKFNNNSKKIKKGGLPPIQGVVKPTKKRSIETGKFSTAIKRAMGYTKGSGLDLSHKKSAFLGDIQYQVMTQHPVILNSGKILDKIEQTTDLSHVTNKKKVSEFKLNLSYLKTHSQYTSGPMSPRSEKASLSVMKTNLNENGNNLRYRDASENRSIGPYPHPNVNNGNLSPRSKGIIEEVDVFQQASQKYLDKGQTKLMESYTSLPTELRKKNGQIKDTSDMVVYRKNF